MDEESVTDGIQGATSVLLQAPLLDAPDNRACMDFLTQTQPRESNVLSVTISETPEDRIALWQRHMGDSLPKRGAIIGPNRAQVDSTQLSVGDSTLKVDLLSENPGPVELAAAIGQCLGNWQETDDPTYVCVHSLTALLDSLDLEQVVHLVQTLNTRFESMDVVAHYHVDSEAHDGQTLADIRPFFDVAVEHLPDHGWTVTRSDNEAPLIRGGQANLVSTTEQWTATPPSTLSYSFDTVVDLLSSPRRRTVLYYLSRHHDDHVHLDTLVAEVFDLAPMVSEQSWASSRQNLKTSLLHVDLPKLGDVGIVEFDRDDEIVRYHGNEALEACLEHAMTLEKNV